MSGELCFMGKAGPQSASGRGEVAARSGPGMRCVLAYSGGLDTTTIVIWLQEQGYEVHAVLVDVGQGEDMEALCRKALRLGAKTAVIRDARPAMCNEVLPWVIRLGATYEGVYRLGTALARPFIAAEQVKLAKSLGGATLVHGATGKGNDQIRFEFAYRSLAPECPVLAPWKVWNLRGRSDMIDYLRQHGVEESFEVTKTYSLDENLWHLSIEGGTLEDPTAHVDVERILGVTADRFTGSTSQAYLPSAVELEFVDGVPVALNGSMGTLATIVNTLNVRFRQAPWAWDMVIENRFTGIKSRGLYINPAAKVLGWAVDALARTCLNKAAYDSYTSLGRDYGAILYRGEFFSDQRKMLESAALPIAGRLTGKVKVELTPAPYVSQIVAPASTFTQERATFEESEFAHQDAAGFIRLAWLSSAGRSFEEADHGGDVAAGSSTPSGVSALQPEPERGLVPAAS